MSNRKPKVETSTEPAIVGNTVLAAAALDKLATDIVNQLDDYARDYNPYEYGLPTHDEHLERQVEIIKRLISSCR